MRPHEKPSIPAPAPDDSAEPCGPQCWRLDAKCREMMSAARQQQRDADEAAARRGGSDGEWAVAVSWLCVAELGCD